MVYPPAYMAAIVSGMKLSAGTRAGRRLGLGGGGRGDLSTGGGRTSRLLRLRAALGQPSRLPLGVREAGASAQGAPGERLEVGPVRVAPHRRIHPASPMGGCFAVPYLGLCWALEAPEAPFRTTRQRSVRRVPPCRYPVTCVCLEAPKGATRAQARLHLPGRGRRTATACSRVWRSSYDSPWLLLSCLLLPRSSCCCGCCYCWWWCGRLPALTGRPSCTSGVRGLRSCSGGRGDPGSRGALPGTSYRCSRFLLGCLPWQELSLRMAGSAPLFSPRLRRADGANGASKETGRGREGH